MEQLVQMVFGKNDPILADEGFLTISSMTFSSFHWGRYCHPKEATCKANVADQLHVTPRFKHPSSTFILVIQYQ